MNNLLCSILFCVTALSLADADCSANPDIENAVFNRKDQCGDVTISCEKGYLMEEVMECIDGEWKYQEPFCKPLECDYNITEGSAVHLYDAILERSEPGLNQSQCDQLCNDNTGCSASIIVDDFCYIFPTPLIFAFLTTDVDQCMATCTQMKDCLMFCSMESQCFIYNVTKNNLTNGFQFIDLDSGIVAEKSCG